MAESRRVPATNMEALQQKEKMGFPISEPEHPEGSFPVKVERVLAMITPRGTKGRHGPIEAAMVAIANDLAYGGELDHNDGGKYTFQPTPGDDIFRVVVTREHSA